MSHHREHLTTLRKLLTNPNLSRPKAWWLAQCTFYDIPTPPKGTIKALHEALEAAVLRPGGLDDVSVDSRDSLKMVSSEKAVKGESTEKEKVVERAERVLENMSAGGRAPRASMVRVEYGKRLEAEVMEKEPSPPPPVTTEKITRSVHAPTKKIEENEVEVEEMKSAQTPKARPIAKIKTRRRAKVKENKVDVMDFEMEYETEYREQIAKLNREGVVDESVRKRRESLFYGDI